MYVHDNNLHRIREAWQLRNYVNIPGTHTHTHTHMQWHSVRNYPCDTSNSPGQLRPAFQMFNRKGVYSVRLFPQVHLERIRSREYRNSRQRNRKMTQLFIILHNGLGTAVEIIFSHMNHNGKGERIAECKLLFAQPTYNSQLKHKVRKFSYYANIIKCLFI